MKKLQHWYEIKNVTEIDSPMLAVYAERIDQNINAALQIQPRHLLRPHVKTNKIKEIQKLMITKGISKFKAATIAEAEMLAQVMAKDVLIAYQLTGPKINRYMELVKKYPSVKFSSLIDNKKSAAELSTTFSQAGLTATVWIDINAGMNRTGTQVGKVEGIYKALIETKGILVRGLHIYDGHIIDNNKQIRKKKCDAAFSSIEKKLSPLMKQNSLEIVAGGTPTFAFHAHRKDVQTSPGTFIFWDWGYAQKFPELPFQYAALVITRVVSIINEKMLCLDLGYKSVASENPLPRVLFLNDNNVVPVSHSEEHLVVKVKSTKKYVIGDIFYGVPVHICPTVALYDKVAVIKNNQCAGYWNVAARNRTINV
jgi:D-serine deaminase-like pyridoxal phosphate-dependent protein